MNAGSEWQPCSESLLLALGAPESVRRALVSRGLPKDAFKMFVRVPERDLEERENEHGRFAFLGVFEDGGNSYWLNCVDGSVWMFRAGDSECQPWTQVNSSVAALQGILKAWDCFIGSGRREEEGDYEDFVATTVEAARAFDPSVFDDEESWWSRVFEEVEYGILAPE